MGSRSVSISISLLLLSVAALGCGSDSEFDPNESAKTRAIRESVRAKMEVERLKRYAPRIAHAAEAAAAAPTATSVHSAGSATGEDSSQATAAAAASATPLDRGSAVYAQNCSNCHGPRGAGDGPVGASLVPQPARHDDGVYMNALSNEHLFKVIKEGGASVGKSPMMAAWGGTMSDDKIRDVIVFVRSLANPPYAGGMP